MFARFVKHKIIKTFGKNIMICVGNLSARDARPGQAPMLRLFGLLRFLKNMGINMEINIVGLKNKKKG